MYIFHLYKLNVYLIVYSNILSVLIIDMDVILTSNIITEMIRFYRFYRDMALQCSESISSAFF